MCEVEECGERQTGQKQKRETIKLSNSEIRLSYDIIESINKNTYKNLRVYSLNKQILAETFHYASVREYNNILLIKQWEFTKSERNKIVLIDKASSNLLCIIHGNYQQMNIHSMTKNSKSYIVVKLNDITENLNEQQGIQIYTDNIKKIQINSNNSKLYIDTCTGSLIYCSMA